MAKNHQQSKKTIGVILGHFEETCQSLILPGIIDYCKANDINLILFNCATLGDQDQYSINYNLISNIFSKESIDGFIIMSGAMGNFFDLQDIKTFTSHFSPLPAVSVALPVTNIPSILVDNKSGITEVVKHLIEVHHYNRMAFVCGPKGHEEAEDRLLAYKETISKYGIDFDESYLAPGNFSMRSGIDAVKLLIDERKLEIDAIICVDDVTARGVISALTARGIRVPEDIAVTGFDDSDEAKSSVPALTTVHQPFYDQGKRSIETLMTIIEGKTTLHRIFLPTMPVIRESCGCFPYSISIIKKLDQLVPVNESVTQNYIINNITPEVLSQFKECSIDTRKIETKLNELFSLLTNSLESSNLEDDFLRTFHDMLRSFSNDTCNASHWHNTLTTARNVLLRYTFSHDEIFILEYLFQKARVLISEFYTSFEEFKMNQVYLKNWLLRQFSQKMIVSFDLDALLLVIEDALKNLGINSCFIVQYQNFREKSEQIPEKSTLVFAYRHNKRITLKHEETVFPSKKMMKLVKITEETTGTFLLMPLFFNLEQLGYIIFEYGPEDKSIYETLRGHISSALKGAMLYHEQKQAEHKLKVTLEHLEILNKELKSTSIRDDLTTLYNRRGYFEIATSYYNIAKITGRPFVLFFLDLDKLKSINDTYGHKEGDFLIISASNILLQSFRKTDIIARIGGDEFIVLATDTTLENLSDINNRLQRNIDAFNTTSNKPYILSMSIGLSLSDSNCSYTLEELMSIADKNLYKEKQSKKLK